ncbi:hypothetical protein EMCRGX_G034203 [Ephydatia muelleri]
MEGNVSEFITLNNGHKIPSFGLGTWLAKPGEVGAAVEHALKTGYRHIDCAYFYFNEKEVGDALQLCIKEGVVTRDQVYITSKLWCNDFAPEDVEPACRLSLQNLQLDYLDLYLVHQVAGLKKDAPSDLSAVTDEHRLGYSPENMAKTWEAMEKLVEKGLTRSIGISNFTITKTENLLKTAKIVPAVNQVECHPYLQQEKLRKYCSTKGIVFEAYSPLGNPARPVQNSDDPNPLLEPVVKEIAAKHAATPAQVCLAFPLQRGMVVIPKSVNLDRLNENLFGTLVELDSEDMARLKALDKNHRLLKMMFLYKTGQTYEQFWDIKEDEDFQLP